MSRRLLFLHASVGAVVLLAAALLPASGGCARDDDRAPPAPAPVPAPAPNPDPDPDLPPDLSFPDTLCGRLVLRLLECEVERIQGQSTLKDAEKRSVISHKRRAFARKRDQYLGHCEKTVAKLPADAVRGCLPLACVEMDRCLQKISGQTGPK
jgi:hypothetical protein